MTENNQILQVSCPRHLTGFANTMWTALVPILIDRGTGQISKSTVESYCMTYDLMRQAYDSIRTEGLVTTEGKKNPLITTYDNAVKTLRSLGADLCLTPASLITLQKIVNESDESDEVDIKSLLSAGSDW